MAVEGKSPIIVHLLVVGFHHSKGSVIEYAYPKFTNQSGEESGVIEAPKEWSDLVHLCIPDGAHNSDQDTVYFTLPGRKNDSTASSVYYGVACYRQTATRDLKYTPDEAIRPTMIKSVCVLCTQPLFGTIETRLNVVTHAYFNEGDFRKVSVLEELYHSLCTTLTAVPTADLSQFGANPGLIVKNYDRATLQLFKALLLQSKVLLVGSCARVTCCHTLSLYSLIPNALESLLNEQLAMNSGIYFSAFSDPNCLRPFVCLSQTNALRSKHYKWTLAGAINPLFGIQQKSYCDVFGSATDGNVVANESELHRALQLTTADLRFCEMLSRGISEGRDSSKIDQTSPTSWYGSDEWIRAQFREYTKSLIVTSIRGDTASKDDFNSHFIRLWLKSECFLDCVNKYVPSGSSHVGLLESIPAYHMCAGRYTWGDIRRKVTSNTSDIQVVASEIAEQVKSSKVGTAVGKIFNTATTSIWSWWNSTGQEESPQEQRQMPQMTAKETTKPPSTS
ncbi:late secretory pathway protein AVL9 homolog [Dysidea avara]|uniref:late secretory pathway protein AVL9 homolog n=1 Tax=Dysidea avara TaxID=196820 RepID=UPI0033262EC9